MSSLCELILLIVVVSKISVWIGLDWKFLDIINESRGKSMLRQGHNHIFAGGSAAILKTLIGQPFDVIATNMIGRYEGEQLYTVCQKIYRNEGFFQGFWKGTFPSLYRLIPHAVGGSARSIAVFVTSPMMLVKTHFEYNLAEDRRVMKTISRIYSTGGIRGLFRGLNSSIVRNAPFGGIFFSIYQFMLSRMKFRNKSANVFCSSVVANMTAHYILHPFGVIRTRIQLQEKSVGMMRGLVDVYKNEGIYSLWRGTIPRISKKALASSVGWTLYTFMFKN